MENAVKSNSWQKPKNRRAAQFCSAPKRHFRRFGVPCGVLQEGGSVNVFVLFAALLSTCIAIFAFGCNDSVQTTANQLDTVFVGNLVPEATRTVRQGLADQDPLIRINAIEVVATTEQIQLMPEVRRLLTDEVVPLRFAAALAVGDLQYSLAESSMRQLLRDENENVRVAAAYAMAKLGSHEHLELLRNAITSNDQTVRANVALLLGKSGDKSKLTLKALWLTMRRPDSHDKVIFQAAEAIAMLGDERILPKLWTMLISLYADVRVMGVRAMGALGTPEASDALVTMLKDDILEVRLAAAEQLSMLGNRTGEPVVLDVFTKNLTAGLDKESRERINVLTALAIGRIGTARLTKFLPQLLKDESKSVRLAAAKAVFQWIMQNRSIGKFST